MIVFCISADSLITNPGNLEIYVIELQYPKIFKKLGCKL